MPAEITNALNKLAEEHAQFKHALEKIAATEPEARVGVDWTHWRQQARDALASSQFQKPEDAA